MNWQSITAAVHGVTYLCRRGSNWYFAGLVGARWRAFGGGEVFPVEIFCE